MLLRIRTLAGESGGTAAAVSLQGLELSYVIKARLGVEQELAVPINERKCKHRSGIYENEEMFTIQHVGALPNTQKPSAINSMRHG